MTGRPSTAPARPPATRLRPPGLLELEELLADHLDTRVGVQMGAKRGRVTIDFADLEDLERIYRLISRGRPATSTARRTDVGPTAALRCDRPSTVTCACTHSGGQELWIT